MDKNSPPLPVIPANAREIHNIEFLAGLDAQLYQGQEILKSRLQQIPNGWRNFRLALSLVEKLIDAVYHTLPDKTMRHMRRLADCGQIIIRPKPAIKLPDDVQIVQTEDLRMLINSAIAAECAICVKTLQEQKGCPLRKCLANIAPTEAIRPDGSCNYIDVAAGNELGKYI